MKSTFLLFISLSLLVRAVSGFAPSNSIIYHDDFTTVQPEWNLSLTQTQNNTQAISASYASVNNGYLRLKANVGSGWDYLFANAALDLMLPDEFVINYRARKSQWAGHFSLSLTDVFVSDYEMQNYLQILYYKEHGHWRDPIRFSNFENNAFSNNDSLAITDSAGYFNYGIWHDYKFIKSDEGISLEIDNVLVLESNFTDFEGNFLTFSAIQVGSTVDIDYLTITTVPEPSTYAFLLGGTVLGYAYWRRRK